MPTTHSLSLDTKPFYSKKKNSIQRKEFQYACPASLSFELNQMQQQRPVSFASFWWYNGTKTNPNRRTKNKPFEITTTLWNKTYSYGSQTILLFAKSKKRSISPELSVNCARQKNALFRRFDSCARSHLQCTMTARCDPKISAVFLGVALCLCFLSRANAARGQIYNPVCDIEGCKCYEKSTWTTINCTFNDTQASVFFFFKLNFHCFGIRIKFCVCWILIKTRVEKINCLISLEFIFFLSWRVRVLEPVDPLDDNFN